MSMVKEVVTTANPDSVLSWRLHGQSEVGSVSLKLEVLQECFTMQVRHVGRPPPGLMPMGA